MKPISTTRSEAVLYRTETLEKYLREVYKEERISTQDERNYIYKAQHGDEDARDKIIRSNLRFVVSIAKEYQRKGVELLDLVSAGNIGLIDAVEKYDLTKEVKFISCAVWWIRARIMEYVRSAAYMVQLPLNRHNELLKVDKIREQIYVKEGIEYSTEDLIALRSDIKGSYVKDSAQCVRETTSIDMATPGNEDFCLAQSMPCESVMMDDILEGERKNILRSSVEKLPEQQQQVLLLSFGLKDGVERSVEEIAGMLKKTTASIKDCRKKALIALKSNRALIDVY